MAAYDLTGYKSGRLTAIKRVDNDQGGRAYWLCQCECGNTTIVQSSFIFKGRTKSCGCLHHENAVAIGPRTAKDISNKRFSSLTAIKTVGSNKHGKRQWLCRCDCGNEVVIILSHLLSGNTKSCGCRQKEQRKQHQQSMIGKRFGRLIAIKSTDKRAYRQVVYLCQCDCGNEKLVSSKDFNQYR